MNRIDPTGMDWILATGDKVYWYGGDYGNTDDLRYTFNASSGSDKARKTTTTADGTKTVEDIDVRYAEYQSFSNVGPTPEGKYELSLEEDPDRTAEIENGQLKRGNGIEKIPENEPVPDQPGYVYDFSNWGKNRVRMQPLKVIGATSKQRDLNSFYFHDSEKGYSHGCTEVQGEFFNVLQDYRSAGNAKIEVRVAYPSPKHHTTWKK
jgi:hypothetical protein